MQVAPVKKNQLKHCFAIHLNTEVAQLKLQSFTKLKKAQIHYLQISSLHSPYVLPSQKSKYIHFLPWTSVHNRIKWHYDLWRRKGTHSEQNSNRWWGSTHSLGIAFCSILLRFHITLTFCGLVLFIHPVRDMFKGTFYCWYHVLDSFEFLWRWINGWMFHHNMAVIISKRSDRSLL